LGVESTVFGLGGSFPTFTKTPHANSNTNEWQLREKTHTAGFALTVSVRGKGEKQTQGGGPSKLKVQKVFYSLKLGKTIVGGRGLKRGPPRLRGGGGVFLGGGLFRKKKPKRANFSLFKKKGG